MQLRNPKQERFCQLYVERVARADTDRTEFALLPEIVVEAGYKYDLSKDKVEAQARSMGYQLLGQMHIVMRIKELKCQKMRANGYSQDEIHKLILDQYISIVSSNITDIMQIVTDENTPDRTKYIQELEEALGGRVLDFGNQIVLQTPMISRETASAIKSFKVSYDKTTGAVNGLDVQFFDKLQAADKLADVAGLKSSNILLASAGDIANDPDAIGKAMALAMELKKHMMTKDEEEAVNSSSEGTEVKTEVQE